MTVGQFFLSQVIYVPSVQDHTSVHPQTVGRLLACYLTPCSQLQATSKYHSKTRDASIDKLIYSILSLNQHQHKYKGISTMYVRAISNKLGSVSLWYVLPRLLVK